MSVDPLMSCTVKATCHLPGRAVRKSRVWVGTVCLDCRASVAEIPRVVDYWARHAGAGVCAEEDDIAWCSAGNAVIVGEGREGLIRSLRIFQIGNRVQDEECENG